MVSVTVKSSKWDAFRTIDIFDHSARKPSQPFADWKDSHKTFHKIALALQGDKLTQRRQVTPATLDHTTYNDLHTATWTSTIRTTAT